MVWLSGIGKALRHQWLESGKKFVGKRVRCLRGWTVLLKLFMLLPSELKNKQAACYDCKSRHNSTTAKKIQAAAACRCHLDDPRGEYVLLQNHRLPRAQWSLHLGLLAVAVRAWSHLVPSGQKSDTSV
eukprot:m.171633 g.171633  ORF g.171633 m.171633 type:complete len:128 (-) comp53267_c0_seq21:959-1342(-)